jgi:hypothetical protein
MTSEATPVTRQHPRDFERRQRHLPENQHAPLP